jgi:hypothetical protein
MLPPCYGKHGDDEECSLCLVSSACADVLLTQKLKGQNQMPPIVKIKMPGAVSAQPKPGAVSAQPKPGAPAPKPVVQKLPVEEDKLDAESAASDYAALDLPTLKAHVAERGLDVNGNKAQLIKRLMKADKAVANEPEPEKETKEKAAPIAKVDSTAFVGLMDLLNAGDTLVFSRISAAKWAVSKGTPQQVSKSKGMRGEAYRKTVLSDEYYAWFYENAGDGKPWSEHSTEEKFAMAQAEGVEWEAKEDARLNLMTMTEAFQIHRGFLKYKPEYQKKSARDALKFG